MNSFVRATVTNQNRGTTFNGAPTLVSTNNPVLDLFSAAGNRAAVLNKEFDLAHSSDPKIAFRVALWARDIRGGAGERQTFRNLLAHFEEHYADQLTLLIPKIPELGRWDDLLVFKTDRVKKVAFAEIQKALVASNGLCAKWMPRKGALADELRRYLDMTPRAYRKMLVRLTKVVESQMCAKQWNEIVFDHVPSVAAARYQKAFGRNAPEKYTEYKTGLVKVKPDGTTERKINAGAVYPYDVIKSIHRGDRAVASAQWDVLPNFLGDNKILPVVDVSGSMGSWSYYGQREPIMSTITPMDVACSLGLYVADKQPGAFNGMFMTFSSRPKLQKLTGSIVDKLNQMYRAHWEMSTNIEAAFAEVLNVAVTNRVPQEDMPAVLLILSDMEFDQCTHNPSDTAYQNAAKAFEAAGYNVPKIVFWKINGRADNNPVEFRQHGTAIVSGFSPALFKSILKADLEAYTPESVMMDTLNSPRYDVPGLTV